MQVDVALDVLGLSGEPTATEVRRAYLRQVKLHPPERDAEGFRRVREAYERLQAGRAMPPEVAFMAQPEPPPLIITEPEPPPLITEPEPSPPEPTFQQPLEQQLARLKEALASDDPLAAADSMIWLYRRPLLESAPVPAPILALQTILELLDRGRFKRAGELLGAMDDYLALNPQLGGFGVEVAARWKLVTELIATSQLDARLARALASGLRSGRMANASGAADAALQEYGPELERHMREKAPTLWAQMAPLLSVPAYRAVDAPPPRSGFKIGGWPGGLVALIVFNLIRLLGASNPPSRPAVDYATPAPHRDVPALLPNAPADAPSATVDAASAAPVAPPTDLAQALMSPAARQTLAWGRLQESTRIGDCLTVREQWHAYLALASGAHSDQSVEATRKHEILEMCPELQDLLEEPP